MTRVPAYPLLVAKTQKTERVLSISVAPAPFRAAPLEADGMVSSGMLSTRRTDRIVSPQVGGLVTPLRFSGALRGTGIEQYCSPQLRL